MKMYKLKTTHLSGLTNKSFEKIAVHLQKETSDFAVKYHIISRKNSSRYNRIVLGEEISHS